ncbi:glycosyltransferase [Butyrivibrio sp. M55]|uniref:glycosyltransferase n=1 Tax=Butyrivibrio sp. M55 TaxID=1855323 RepID=UPI0008E0E6AE|nr:glycosyltransferase [Butyrivibrio sp. M55]SFU44429.1 UDP:flavonoid glycosyltransferase YjiC, YdhE family [Butyrivibrio sp. M55]
MSKIAIFTMGTRGDVQLYIYLARKLIEEGIDTIIGTHPHWKDLVEEAGVKFVPIGSNINIEREMAAIRGNGTNPMSAMREQEFVADFFQNATHDILNACKGRDMVIVGHTMIGAVEAEALGIPTINVTLQKESIPEKLRQQTVSEKVLENFGSNRAIKPFNNLRKIYGLRPIKSVDELFSDRLNLMPISRTVNDRNPYWEAKNVVTGFWYEDDVDFVPDEKLKNFMETGDKPVVLSFGSMSYEDDVVADKLDKFIKAFEATDTKVIIQGFQKSIATNYKLPDSIMSCGDVPHSWLFSRSRYVIHHCGFGTCAASMVYGVPSIPIPYMAEHVKYAIKLNDLGIATKMVKVSKVSKRAIMDVLDEMNSSYYFKKERAEEISKKVRAENGLDDAVRRIKDVLH